MAKIVCEAKDILGTSAQGFDGQRHPEDCTPETCPCFEAGLASVLSIRCREHYAIPQQNKAEHQGAECGGCIAAERDALRTRLAEADERIKVLEDRAAGFLAAVNAAEHDVAEWSTIANHKADLLAEADERVQVLVNAGRSVVDGIDHWNAEMQRIIGRVPNYGWGNLEALRAALGRPSGDADKEE